MARRQQPLVKNLKPETDGETRFAARVEARSRHDSIASHRGLSWEIFLAVASEDPGGVVGKGIADEAHGLGWAPIWRDHRGLCRESTGSCSAMCASYKKLVDQFVSHSV